jgi:hypothetical protein
MRDCESMPVLRINASRTVWPEIRSGRLLAQNTELPRPLWGAGQLIGVAQNVAKRRVDVHRRSEGCCTRTCPGRLLRLDKSGRTGSVTQL